MDGISPLCRYAWSTAWMSLVACAFVEHSRDWLGYYPLLSLALWFKLHVAGQRIFVAAVWGGSVAEVVAFLLGQYPTMLKFVPFLDDFVAEPALAVTVVAGVALTKIKYTSKGKPIPVNIQRAIRLLIGLAVVWAVADRATQHAHKPNDIFAIRCTVNVLECVLVYYLQALMFVAQRQ